MAREVRDFLDTAKDIDKELTTKAISRTSPFISQTFLTFGAILDP